MSVSIHAEAATDFISFEFCINEIAKLTPSMEILVEMQRRVEILMSH